jgi:NDP-sugar pyrophosphorylase family protein
LTVLPCLVLGGGLGTRMRPATDAVPKPLLPVCGEPFAVHQLRWLAGEGVTDVVYSIGHLGHLLRDELSARTDLGCSLRFVDEGSTLMGTGGAVRLAVDREPRLREAFFVLYGDSFLDIDLSAVADAFRASGAEALMTVFRNDDRWERSNVVFDRDRVERYDKRETDPAGAGMHHVDYGLSVLQGDTVHARIPDATVFDLADLFRDLSLEGRLAGFEAAHRFYEIGTPAGLADLEAHLAERAP